jgi:hypothetical protein
LSGENHGAALGPRPESFAERLNKVVLAETRDQTAVGSGLYKPYGYMPSGVGESCDIQRWIEGTEKPTGVEVFYKFLIQLGYVGEEQIKLYFPDAIIILDGSNLLELRKKLARRQITFIQQWSSRVWPDLPPKGEPVIASIKIVRLESDQSRNDT